MHGAVKRVPSFRTIQWMAANQSILHLNIPNVLNRWWFQNWCRWIVLILIFENAVSPKCSLSRLMASWSNSHDLPCLWALTIHLLTHLTLITLLAIVQIIWHGVMMYKMIASYSKKTWLFKIHPHNSIRDRRLQYFVQRFILMLVHHF